MKINFTAEATISQYLEPVPGHEHLTAEDIADGLESGKYMTTLGYRVDGSGFPETIDELEEVDGKPVFTPIARIVMQDVEEGIYQNFDSDED